MNKAERRFRLMKNLQNLGFNYEEGEQLRRIEMTLQRWGEAECGDERGTCIERDEETGKPFRTYEKSDGKRGRYPVADREAGALKRLAKIMAIHPDLVAYHQGDCRGCNLYILRKADVNGGDINQVYTRGLAVCD
jgi:hypothetical protein